MMIDEIITAIFNELPQYRKINILGLMTINAEARIKKEIERLPPSKILNIEKHIKHIVANYG